MRLHWIPVLVLAAGLRAQAPAVGDRAPAFEAPAHSGKQLAFPAAKRWSVLAFYPRAGTPG